MNKFKYFLDWLIPRFVTEQTIFAFDEVHQAWMPFVSLVDFKIFHEDYKSQMLLRTQDYCIGTMSCFNLFGYAKWPKLIGDIREVTEEDLK